MAQVSVNIAGRLYRMACEDGQEPHLEKLARELDAKISEMKTSFGEIGDQRLTVMAAIAMADDRSEAARRAAGLEAEVKRLREAAAAAAAGHDEWSARVGGALEDTAARVERAAKRIDAGR